jgi:hypothetical protein
MPNQIKPLRMKYSVRKASLFDKESPYAYRDRFFTPLPFSRRF